MHIRNIFITVLLLLFIFGLALLGSFTLSGNEKRAYEVIDPDLKIKFKGEETLIRDLVVKYQPVLYQIENLRSSHSSKIFYEVISKMIHLL